LQLPSRQEERALRHPHLLEAQSRMEDCLGEEWEEYKELGNEAFKARQFTTAVEHFSKAIELKSDAHVLYSNRSGAYASLGQWADALKDAERCIKLKKDWGKGYGRKGAALEGKGDLEGAKRAYEAGLKEDASSATLVAGLKAVESKIALLASRPSYPGPPPATGEMPGKGTPTLLNYAIVACTIFYMFPVLGARIGFYSYKAVLVLGVVKHSACIVRTYGISRAAFGQLQRIMDDENAHYLALCVILSIWRPIPFCIIPMATYAVGSMVPDMLKKLDGFPARVQALIRPRLNHLAGEDGHMLIMAFATTSEVMVAVTLILSCIANIRNVGVLIFYWNFLGWRYNKCQWTKHAVWALHDKARELCHHKYAPKILGLGFEKVRMMITAYYARRRSTPQ